MLNPQGILKNDVKNLKIIIFDTLIGIIIGTNVFHISQYALKYK